MRNDSSTGQLIVGSFCIIFALIFYQLMQDSFVIIAGIGGIILVITGLHGYKGFSNKIVTRIILFVFGGILIYLVFTFPFSSPEKKITISLLFVLILLWAVPFYRVRRKISEFNKGIKMLDSGKYEESYDYFSKILKNDPNNPLALAGKSFTLQKIGKYEEALQSIDNALSLKYKVEIKIFSLSKLLVNSLIFNMAGLIYIEERDYEKALEYFNKALESNKNFHTVWNNKGVALSRMGKMEESLKCFDKALVIVLNLLVY
ncbi:MAG: tetratricopeptide repeat protein [Methanobacteriaceae archaeon]|jgi:tetratricopeptide (TPR) repeat protein|nr:tetratricopeptide repeat protein [Methanobacteriaceae archaeon]MDP2836561.1 tetratricopeptide repeat protein [Methanobacteriaceae archaeon]MDP3034316.1 tetratricopeptide repeat protein [Methanobacteriaceae archaeon]MDP3485493.1 tetratricopeptide repeat protein [Methanobacteriaceae archaeon]MDP3622376.1 tetratricopeptide repeat protein [Methanobacteriaceae archaeon]